MAEPKFQQDDAALYVVGDMAEATRHKFEAEMENSAQLRSVVRELEPGLIVLSLAAPQCEPPSHVWRQIEETISSETRKTIARPLIPSWLRDGWTAAAACLVGLLFYILWNPRATIQSTGQPTTLATSPEQVIIAPAPVVVERTARQSSPSIPSASNRTELSLETKGRIAGLHRQVAELEQQVANLAQTVDQQRAVFAQSSAHFFQLTPPDSTAHGGNVAMQPSPELQRAVLMTMARELGWLPVISTRRADEEFSETTQQSTDGVDFIYLSGFDRNNKTDKMGTDAGQEKTTPTPEESIPAPVAQNPVPTPPPTQPQAQPQTQPANSDTAPGTQSTTVASTPAGAPVAPTETPGAPANPQFTAAPAIAGVAGGYSFVAIDGQQLSQFGQHANLVYAGMNGEQTVVGTVSLGNNPTVVLAPMETMWPGRMSIRIGETIIVGPPTATLFGSGSPSGLFQNSLQFEPIQTQPPTTGN